MDKKIKGFTLIEVLVTSIISVIVMTGIVMFFTILFRLNNDAIAEMSVQDTSNLIYSELASKMRMARNIDVISSDQKSIRINNKDGTNIEYQFTDTGIKKNGNYIVLPSVGTVKIEGVFDNVQDTGYKMIKFKFTISQTYRGISRVSKMQSYLTCRNV